MKLTFPILIAAAALALAGCETSSDADSMSKGSGDTAKADTMKKDETMMAKKPSGPPPGSQLDLEVNIGDRVFFDFDKSNLKPEARTAIERWAAWLKTYPQNRVVIEGHADERGTREYNLGLGERRGNAVSGLLSAAGAMGSQLDTVSYGEERPVCRVSDDSCWSQNRRVEIVYTAR